MSDLDSPHSPDHPMQDAFSDHEPDHEDHDHHGVAMVIEPATQIPSTQPPPHHVPTEEDLDAKYPNRPKNTNPTLPFHTLYTELFEPLLSNKRKLGVGGRGFKNLKPHEIRQGIIERFIDLWRGKVGLDIYPAFRLIMPDKDRDRTVYGLKEKIIGKILVKIMKINKISEDALALIDWKLPGRGGGGLGIASTTGDFAGRCYEVIKKRPMMTSPGELTVAQVNEMLDRLSICSKEEQQLPIFNEFYNNMNAQEMMWIIRIIMKQMKVGATEKTFFNAWHPDAENLFNVSSSLKRVCWELYDPNIRLDSAGKGVTLLSCFQPQLAQFQKRSLEHTVDLMRRGGAEQFWIEEKLDGERMQMHMNEGEFRWWSRKAKDYTYLYGAGEGSQTVDGSGEDEFRDGSLVRYLGDAFDPGVKSIILDGEMITWDPSLDCIVAFGTLKTACLAQAKNPFDITCHRPLFRVFDILYLNGESLVNYTLTDRRRALAAAIRPVHRRLEVHGYTPATTVQEIQDSLRKVVAEASEGLVIKNPFSSYRLNERNDDWVKVKPEYMTEYGEDLDCCIIGGYYGSGRRGGFLSSFLCGLRVDGNFRNPNDPEHRFWSFFKVGGGLTAADYTKIQHVTAGKWEKYDPKKPPKEYIELAGGQLQYERPDEWIRPEDSLVVAVKAASLSVTDQFRMGKTLRFPRFKTFRDDKDWRSALSITEFLNLQARVDKEVGEKMKVEKKVRLGGAGRARKRRAIVIGEEEEVKTPYAGPETMVFEGLSVYIMTDSSTPGYKKSKSELEQLVKSNGGRFFQSPTAAPGIVLIGDKKTVKVSAIIKGGKHDIIRPMWLLDSLSQYMHDKEASRLVDAVPKGGNFLLPLEPNYLLHGQPKTVAVTEGNIDEHGDSYFRDVNVPRLARLLEDMPLDHPRIDLNQAPDFRESLLHGKLPREFNPDGHHKEEEDMEDPLTHIPGWTLSQCVAYLDVGNDVLPPLAIQVTEQLLLFMGARISKSPYEQAVTHVIVLKGDLSRVRGLRAGFAQRIGEEEKSERVPRVVSEGWVEECVKERTWVDEGKWIV